MAKHLTDEQIEKLNKVGFRAHSKVYFRIDKIDGDWQTYGMEVKILVARIQTASIDFQEEGRIYTALGEIGVLAISGEMARMYEGAEDFGEYELFHGPTPPPRENEYDD